MIEAAGADGVDEGFGDVLLADHFGERLRPVFAVERECHVVLLLVAPRRYGSSGGAVLAAAPPARRRCHGARSAVPRGGALARLQPGYGLGPTFCG
ncbi:hypothetical protein GCM10009853_022120 [Glycomyces scopariae]